MSYPSGTDDDFVIERAYKVLIERMGSAQRKYDATMSDSERELAETCGCDLCAAMRLIRAQVAEYEAGLATHRQRLLRVLDERAWCLQVVRVLLEAQGLAK